MSKQLTSADIQDGKVEVDPSTGAKSVYKKIKGGYEVTTTTQQPNGTIKTQTKTFYDPTPVSADDNLITSADIEDGKTVIDPITKIKTVYKKVKGGYEVITSTPQPDGTIKTRTQTFYDPIPAGQSFDIDDDSSSTTTKKKTTSTTNKAKTDRSLVKRTDQLQQQDSFDRTNQEVSQTQTQLQSKQVKKTKENRRDSQTTVEEVHMSQKTEYSGKRTITRKGTVEESFDDDSNIQAITDKKDKKKKKASSKTVTEDGKTTVVTKKVPGGTEYHYSTIQENGETVTSVKTVYDEEETELTEEEIKQYHKHLKEAEKHKDLTAPKTVKTKQGTTKKVIPSEESGEITTVETVKIDGGTEYHYTTVTAEGIVKKSMKTVYDAVTVEENEQEIIEEYEEEIIEPGEPIVETIQHTKIVQKSEFEKKTIEVSSNGSIIKKKERKSKK